jgi:N utilization substance protein B
MLNRRHIRVKVMQLIYANGDGENADLKLQEKLLTQSMEGMFQLYLLMISLMGEVQLKAEDYLKKKQQKILATEEEKNPNRKFISNQVIQLISKNDLLKASLEKHKLNNWQLDNEYVEVVFRALLESDYYNDYMSTRNSNFNEDREFAINFFKHVVAPNDKLYDYLEDKKLTWLDDLPVVNTIILKLIRKVKPNSLEQHFLPKLFKDAEDRYFGSDLLKKTILNIDGFSDEVSRKTQNWDKDRIANLDLILLQMAICEFQKFPSIPVKVTINEYLEISKEYSTPKSSIFINGILDKLVKEYTDKGTLNKSGRGLM